MENISLSEFEMIILSLFALLMIFQMYILLRVDRLKIMLDEATEGQKIAQKHANTADEEGVGEEVEHQTSKVDEGA